MLKINLLKNKILCVALCLAMIIPVLCGCSSEKKHAANDNTLTFTDALNRTVTVSKNPERVAALLGSFAEIWQLSGADVCAAPEDAWDDFELELKNCVNLGGAHTPSLEKLLSSDPDLVLASASTASNVELKSSLEKSGITVAYFDVDSFSDYLRMLDICTDITGRKDLYAQNGKAVQKQIESIVSGFESAGIPEEKRRVLVLRASSGSVKAKGSNGTVLGEMLSNLGCINIADNDTSLLEELSVEGVIRQEPYHIFAVAMGNEKVAQEKLLKMLNANPAWATLEAVSANRVHMLDRKLFNLKPNKDWAIAYEILIGTLLENSNQN